MLSFSLTRKHMANFLAALDGKSDCSPLDVLQRAHMSNFSGEPKNTASASDSVLPPIFEKLLKNNKRPFGLSVNDIVSLGNQIEFNHLTSAAVHNWVKRDVKTLVGSPQIGKRYTVEQAAILLIVEDLKTALDFESIRKLLTLVFNNPADRSDDMISPLQLYAACGEIFDRVYGEESTPIHFGSSLEKKLLHWAKERVTSYDFLSDREKETVQHVLTITVYAALTSYTRSMARQYFHTVWLLPK